MLSNGGGRAGVASANESTHEVACVVHVHSTLSDGTATVGAIASAASVAGADAVLEVLAEGRSFLARPWVGDARGFRFWAEHSNRAADMGAEVATRDGLDATWKAVSDT